MVFGSSLNDKQSLSNNKDIDLAFYGDGNTLSKGTESERKETKITKIIKGRRNAVQEAFTRSLTSINDYYCITGDELSKSYKPFIPLLYERINQRHGSTKILTDIENETIQAVRELIDSGAQVRHIERSNLRRCVVYDN